MRHLSSHVFSSWCCNEWRGNTRVQNLHSEGSSETVFSTARFLEAVVLEISTRQLGHVAASSRSRASASKCVKHGAHMRWPLLHCNITTMSVRGRGVWCLVSWYNVLFIMLTANISNYSWVFVYDESMRDKMKGMMWSCLAVIDSDTCNQTVHCNNCHNWKGLLNMFHDLYCYFIRYSVLPVQK